MDLEAKDSEERLSLPAPEASPVIAIEQKPDDDFVEIPMENPESVGKVMEEKGGNSDVEQIVVDHNQVQNRPSESHSELKNQVSIVASTTNNDIDKSQISNLAAEKSVT